MGKYNTMN